ncbi:hypothetical protein C8J57DRAFT_138012 [Mycena rebaudengoi]|nr:hypothetical protein C8J57DRAFT_138012 [Mycena rebaudengoi]
MRNLGSISDQTLAGIIATSTHGSGVHFPIISAHVRALTLLTAANECRPDLFGATICGLGLTGFILTITLEVEDRFRLRYRQWMDPFAELVPPSESQEPRPDPSTPLRPRASTSASGGTPPSMKSALASATGRRRCASFLFHPFHFQTSFFLAWSLVFSFPSSMRFAFPFARKYYARRRAAAFHRRRKYARAHRHAAFFRRAKKARNPGFRRCVVLSVLSFFPFPFLFLSPAGFSTSTTRFCSKRRTPSPLPSPCVFFSSMMELAIGRVGKGIVHLLVLTLQPPRVVMPSPPT